MMSHVASLAAPEAGLHQHRINCMLSLRSGDWSRKPRWGGGQGRIERRQVCVAAQQVLIHAGIAMVDGEEVKEFLVEGFEPCGVDRGHGHPLFGEDGPELS